jgi:hypothetical protein
LEEDGGHVYFFKHRAHRKIMDRFFDRHLKWSGQIESFAKRRKNNFDIVFLIKWL